MTTLHDAITRFLATIDNAHTARTYGVALAHFEQIAPAQLAQVDEAQLIPFAESLSEKAGATRDGHLSAVISFFAFLVMMRMSETVSLDRARLIKRKIGARPGKRISNYAAHEVEALLDYVRDRLIEQSADRHEWFQLLALRDRALILTLAETGLRRAEAASLKLRDVDLENGQAVVIGKGDKQAVIYFGETSLAAVREYIEARPNRDPAAPLFMRHDKAQGADPDKHVTPQAINHAIKLRAREAIGEDHHVHAHALRHYFITRVWKETGDLMLAKELARHESIQTTVRYTHVDNSTLRSAHARIFARKD